MPETSTVAPEQEEAPSPFTRPGFIASAAVLGLILVVGVVAMLLPRSTPTAPAPAAPSAVVAAPAGCSLPAGDQTPPATAPTGTSWVLVGRMAAPHDPATFGPAGSTSSGLGSCYAHNPTGALYAAANFVAACTDPGPGRQLAAARELTAPGPGRDQLVATVAGGSVGASSGGVQLAGFVFLSYTPTAATVDLAVTAAGKYAHLPIALAWTGTDWAVQVPLNGAVFGGTAALPDLTGFVAWSGV